MIKETVLEPMPPSIVASVVAPVQNGLKLGFRKPSAIAGYGADVTKWQDAFGIMNNMVSSFSFFSSITSEWNRSVSNVAFAASFMLLLLMAHQAISAGKQPSDIIKRFHEHEQFSDRSRKCNIKKRSVFSIYH